MPVIFSATTATARHQPNNIFWLKIISRFHYIFQPAPYRLDFHVGVMHSTTIVNINNRSPRPLYEHKDYFDRFTSAGANRAMASIADGNEVGQIAAIRINAITCRPCLLVINAVLASSHLPMLI